MQNNKGGGAPRLKKIYIRTMNSDKNSIQNQGGGEPKPFKPGEGNGNQGSTPNQNQSPKPQNPGQGQQGGQSPKPSGGDSKKPNSPGMPGTSNAGQSPQPQQGGGIQKPKGPGEGENDNDTIPSPPGGDSNFQENFSKSKGQPSSGAGSSGSEMNKGQNQGGMGQSSSGMPGGEDQPPMKPPQDFNQEDIEGDEYPPKKKSNKKLFITLLIVILALGAAVAVYFMFLSPSEQPETPAVDDTQDQQQEQVDENETDTTDETDETDDADDNNGDSSTEVPTVPNATTSDDNEEDTTSDETDEQDQQEQADSQETSGVSADSHESLLSTSADNENNVTLSSINRSSIVSELNQSATETPLFTEWILQDESENLVTFDQLANMLAPTVFTEDVANQFNQDATIVTYTNDQGSWLGLVASLSSDAEAQSVKDQVTSLEENVSEVKNFFFSDPGSQNNWTDGGAGDVTSRYITFGDGNAAFNYGWDGNTLVIGTSYSTFQEIVNHL